jgi:hypothetical protein
VHELDALIDDWLPLPDVADRLGVDVGKVRRMLQERQLVAVRRGERNILSVPAALLRDDQLMPELPGTVNVLADAGYQAEDALRWLFTADETIVGGSPIGALHAGHKTEVRRRAQALAL